MAEKVTSYSVVYLGIENDEEEGCTKLKGEIQYTITGSCFWCRQVAPRLEPGASAMDAICGFSPSVPHTTPAFVPYKRYMKILKKN